MYEVNETWKTCEFVKEIRMNDANVCVAASTRGNDQLRIDIRRLRFGRMQLGVFGLLWKVSRNFIRTASSKPNSRLGRPLTRLQKSDPCSKCRELPAGVDAERVECRKTILGPSLDLHTLVK